MAFTWHGNLSPVKTEDEAVDRAIKATCSSVSAQVRIVQGNEPPYFRSIFNRNSSNERLLIHHGGAYFGNYESFVEKSRPYSINEHVFHVKIHGGDPNTAYAVSIPTLASQLNSHDCFILFMDKMSYLWMGQYSSEEDRTIAYDIAGKIAEEPFAVIKVSEGEEMEEFWDVLGGKKSRISANGSSLEKYDPSKLPSGKAPVKLLSIADGWEWTPGSPDFTRKDLTPDTLALLDVDSHTFLWVGSAKKEVTSMFYKSYEYLDCIDEKDSESRTVMVVLENEEHSEFTEAFGNWKVIEEDATMQNLLEKEDDELSNTFHSCLPNVSVTDEVDVASSSKNDESSGIIVGTEEVLPLLEQSTPDSNTLDSATVNENDSSLQVTSKEMSEDSPTLEKATDQLCIDEVEIEKEEDELSDQVDVASSSDNDKIKVTETIEGTVLAGKSLSIDETESLKMSSNDTNNNVKGKQALSTVTEKKTEELSAVEKCSQIVDVKNKKSNNSNSNVKVEKKLTIEDTNDKEQNLDKKELLECEVTEHYTLEDLQVPIKGVDWKKREFYLTQEDFQNIFKITLEEYKDLKPWKRMQCKKNAGLF